MKECDKKSYDKLLEIATLSIWSNPTTACLIGNDHVGKPVGQYGKSDSLKSDGLLG
ncbi:hypothetical protein [Streptococcus agalactiae]|uniref:hypothetical protein n=1 Tax=Streptococcus agalactiae TaxID=1311 RepID=UPI0012B68215|nr:hypothetical protein [Streptococcus agalactiae]